MDFIFSVSELNEVAMVTVIFILKMFLFWVFFCFYWVKIKFSYRSYSISFHTLVYMDSQASKCPNSEEGWENVWGEGESSRNSDAAVLLHVKLNLLSPFKTHFGMEAFKINHFIYKPNKLHWCSLLIIKILVNLT